MGIRPGRRGSPLSRLCRLPQFQKTAKDTQNGMNIGHPVDQIFINDENVTAVQYAEVWQRR